MKLIPEITPDCVVAVASHPDDLDFFTGGTLAKWAAAGTKVILVILSRGGKGSSDVTTSAAELTSRREAEQRAAATQLGVHQVFFEDFVDNEMANTPDMRRIITRYVRRFQADVVVSWDPKLIYSVEHSYVNHRDHREVSLAVQDVVLIDARNALTFPELIAEEGLEPHKVPTLMFFSLTDEVNYITDIADFVEAKREAMRSHASQPEDIERFARFEEFFGLKGGIKRGEGFVLLHMAL